MPLNEDNDYEYYNNRQPLCPFCDYEIDIAQHDLYDIYNYDESETEIECPSCEKSMKVRPCKTWTF